MQIIRDEELGRITMLPLLVQWGVRRCNMLGCRSKEPSTIVTGTEAGIFGLCEDCWEKVKGKEVKITLDFTMSTEYKLGSKIFYVGNPYKRKQKGIIKTMHPDGGKAWCVYNCANDWDNYEEYTGVLSMFGDIALADEEDWDNYEN